MCYMIVVGLPKARQLQWLQKLPPKMRAWPASYTDLSLKIKNFAPFVIGTSMCSCDLYNRGSDTNEFKRYRKKGWSQGKIERAMADRKKANRHTGLHPDLRQWLADAAADAGEAYLFIHWVADDLILGETILVSPQDVRKQTFNIQSEQLLHIKDQ